MGPSNSWHSGSACVSASWAVPVPLLPDELFSSWLARAALAQGCDPLVLTGALWPRWRVWTNDPDRGLSEDRALALAEISGLEVAMFEVASLRPAAAAIALAPLDALSIWPWTLALGSRNRRRHGGLQFCPLCLQNDWKPYYRIQWRLAWHTGCSEHGVQLLDRCPRCNAPIEPHRLLATDSVMSLCATCKFDLRKSATVVHTPTARAFQQAADEILANKQGSCGASRPSVGHWLELSRYFVMLLRKVALRRTDGLVVFAKALGVDVDNLQPPATGLALELLPVAERTMLLADTWKMLKVTPDHFLSAATRASLTRSSLCERHQPIPELIATIIEALPEKFVSRQRKTQSNASKPRSRQTVMRIFARLQRKMLVATR